MPHFLLGMNLVKNKTWFYPPSAEGVGSTRKLLGETRQAGFLPAALGGSVGRRGGSTSEQQPALGIGGHSGITAAEVGSARGRGAGASAGAAQMVPTAQGCPAVSWPNALAKAMTACLFSKFSACCGMVLPPASSEDTGLEVVARGSFSVASGLILLPWGCLHLGLGEEQPRYMVCLLHTSRSWIF